MKKKTASIEFDVSERFMIRDGKYYVHLGEVKGSGGHKLLFKEVNKKAFEKELMKLSKELVKKSKIKAVKIVFEALRQLPYNEIQKIERNLKKKKPVTAEEGCLTIEVGNASLPIVG